MPVAAPLHTPSNLTAIFPSPYFPTVAATPSLEPGPFRLLVASTTTARQSECLGAWVQQAQACSGHWSSSKFTGLTHQIITLARYRRSVLGSGLFEIPSSTNKMPNRQDLRWKIRKGNATSYNAPNANHKKFPLIIQSNGQEYHRLVTMTKTLEIEPNKNYWNSDEQHVKDTPLPEDICFLHLSP